MHASGAAVRTATAAMIPFPSSVRVRPSAGETQEILTSAQMAAWSLCRGRKVSLQLRLSVSRSVGRGRDEYSFNLGLVKRKTFFILTKMMLSSN